MQVVEVMGREVSLDDEGFLTDASQWDEELARTLAGNIGLTLTERHMELIGFARADHAARGAAPTINRLREAADVAPAELFALFPVKPAKKLAYVAGLPKPVECV